MPKKTLDASIIQYLLEFTEQLKRGGDILLQEHDLTSQQWTLLLHLAKDPNLPFFKDRDPEIPIMASELALYFNVSRANITNLLNSLIDKNLILQKEDDTDRRRKILNLTEAGQQLVDAIETLRIEANERLFATFNLQEKELFLEYIDRCLIFMTSEIKKIKSYK